MYQKIFLNSDDLNLYKYWFSLKDKDEFKNCKIFIFTNRDIDKDQDFLGKKDIENNEFVFENECNAMKFKHDNGNENACRYANSIKISV